MGTLLRILAVSCATLAVAGSVSAGAQDEGSGQARAEAAALRAEAAAARVEAAAARAEAAAERFSNGPRGSQADRELAYVMRPETSNGDDDEANYADGRSYPDEAAIANRHASESDKADAWYARMSRLSAQGQTGAAERARKHADYWHCLQTRCE